MGAGVVGVLDQGSRVGGSRYRREISRDPLVRDGMAVGIAALQADSAERSTVGGG
jgi:hypothetical protein